MVGREPSNARSKCQTCQIQGPVWEQICKFEAMRRNGETDWSVGRFRDWLHEHYDYELSREALEAHVRRGCGDKERQRRTAEH